MIFRFFKSVYLKFFSVSQFLKLERLGKKGGEIERRIMETKKDERTWRDVGSVELHRVENVKSTEDRSVDAKSYIKESGLESALKEELSKVLSMPADSRPPPQLLLETIGKAFIRRTRENRQNFVRRASNMSIGFPVSFPIDSEEDEDEEN